MVIRIGPTGLAFGTGGRRECNKYSIVLKLCFCAIVVLLSIFFDGFLVTSCFMEDNEQDGCVVMMVSGQIPSKS